MEFLFLEKNDFFTQIFVCKLMVALYQKSFLNDWSSVLTPLIDSKKTVHGSKLFDLFHSNRFDLIIYSSIYSEATSQWIESGWSSLQMAVWFYSFEQMQWNCGTLFQDAGVNNQKDNSTYNIHELYHVEPRIFGSSSWILNRLMISNFAII